MAERIGILCAESGRAGPARTAAALARHGAEVCIIAPPDSLVAKTRFKCADILMPFADLNRFLPPIMRTLAEEFSAHSFLVGDDTAFAALARFLAHMDEMDVSAATRAMIARSLPDGKTAALLASDSDFIVAQQGGACSAPRSLANPTPAEAAAFAAKLGYPVMVKRDGYASGAGVRLCADEGQLRTAIATTPDAPRHATFVVQEYIAGTVYGATVSGVKGRAMAAFSFIKHCTVSAYGATSVAKFAPRDDILAHARGVFEASRLNGYAGFDYVVDAKGQPRFIEINPRIMPTGHFAECFGVDLTAAFLAGIRGLPAPEPKPPRNDHAALFPSEWARDPSSPHLRTAFHDVPWDDPPVFAALIDKALELSTRAARLGFLAY